MFGGLPLKLFEPLILLCIMYVLGRYFLAVFRGGGAGIIGWFLFQLVAIPFRIMAWVLRELWIVVRDRHVVHGAITGRRPRRSRLVRMAERSARTNPKPPEVLYGSNGEVVMLDPTEEAPEPDYSKPKPVGPDDWKPAPWSSDYVPDDYEAIWQAHLRNLERQRRWGWLLPWLRHKDPPTGQDRLEPSF